MLAEDQRTTNVQGYFSGMILYCLQTWREQRKADNPNLNVSHQSSHIPFLSKMPLTWLLKWASKTLNYSFIVSLMTYRS